MSWYFRVCHICSNRDHVESNMSRRELMGHMVVGRICVLYAFSPCACCICMVFIMVVVMSLGEG